MLHRTTEYRGTHIERQLWGNPNCALRRDPAFLPACFDKPYNDKALFMLFSSPLVPTPAILQDRGLIIQILQRCPAFLRQPDIPPEFFTDRE